MESLNAFIGVIKPALEFVYFVACISMAVFAFYGLQQITILKNTAAIQAKRDALRLTSEQCSIYMERIIPLQNSFYLKLREMGLKYFEGWTISLENGEIVASRTTPVDSKGLDKLIEEFRFLNAMEAFAVYFTSRVADEQVAYNTLGKTFLSTCESVLPFILSCRKDNYYKNLVELYVLWKKRCDSEKLLAEKKSIEKRLSESRITLQTPIGTSN